MIPKAIQNLYSYLFSIICLALIFAAPAFAAPLDPEGKPDFIPKEDIKKETLIEAFEADRLPAQNLPAVAGKVACVAGVAGDYPCQNVDLLAFLPLADIGGGGNVEGNDIWGWTGCGGREFALMGLTNGSSFVEITDPINPVYLGRLPSQTGSSLWRDIKTYNDHAFIVSEAPNHGIQVFDLTQLCNVSSPPTTFANTAYYSSNNFGSAHNIAINEDSGYAYGVDVSFCQGLHMVDINSPTSPSFAGCYIPDGQAHDAQCINYNGPDTQHASSEICFTFNGDSFTIDDVTNKSAPSQLAKKNLPLNRYIHQGWVTENHQYLLLNDEFDEWEGVTTKTRTFIWDISDLDAPTFVGYHDGATAAIDHNLYIQGDYAYEANYRRGFELLDISDIALGNLSLVGYFDVYTTSNSSAFNGAWSVFPYFDSGAVVVSGIEQGLFVLDPTTVGACIAPDSPDPINVAEAANGTDVELSWTTTNDSSYTIMWKANNPYFSPGDSGVASNDATMPAYTHANGVGDQANNYYYLVANSCDEVGAAPHRVGEFDFDILPGVP